MKMSAFLPSGTYAEISVSWTNPYTTPASGIRYLWACCTPWPEAADGMRTVELEEWVTQHAPEAPYGYTLTMCFDKLERRRFSPEAKASIRKSRMVARIMKKDPLFADQFIAEQLKRPYFDPAQIAEDDKVHAAKMARLEEKYHNEFVEQSVVKRG